MSSESELIAALRTRLAQADTAFLLSRCHFEAHALLRKFPGSVEGRMMLEQIDRDMRSQSSELDEPPTRQIAPPSIWRTAIRPLPWVVGLMVAAYIAMYFLRRLLK